MNVELTLFRGETGMRIIPVSVVWFSQRGADRLLFRCFLSEAVYEGTAVSFKADGKGIFFGYVFSHKRGKDGSVMIMAYDGLRYLMNRDTYIYENKTASWLVRKIADDYGIQTGEIEETGVVIASRIEENVSLLDMIENALELTQQGGGEKFFLFDDFGKLSLKSRASMVVGKNGEYLLIDGKMGEDFEYSSGIENGSYNRVKLVYNDKKAGQRETYIAMDEKNIARWGTLQYYGNVSGEGMGQSEAEAILKRYNKENRQLKLFGVFGDLRVRAGSTAAVNLDIPESKGIRFMTVESVTHRIEGRHLMDLTLSL